MDLIESKCRQLKLTVYNRVTEQSLAEGKERYGNWAAQDYRWYQSDYNHCGFRAVYFDRLFKSRAEIVKEALDYCDLDLPEENDLNVVSFGCGPGCDLLGFQQYYQQKKKQRITELQKRLRRQQAQSTQDNPRQRSSVDDTRAMIREIKNAKISYTGYDSSSGWREYISSLRYTFTEKHIDEHFVDGMEPVDVAILCYFSHSVNLQQQSESSFWQSLKRKCKVILVLDTVYKKEEFNGMLSSLGFRELDAGLKDEGGREVYTTLWTCLTATRT